MVTRLWTAKQFGRVVDQLRADCPTEAWKDLLGRYAILRALGPMCGTDNAKKLVNGKGIWELLGHAGNCQPRLLFYFSDRDHEIRFMCGFIKQSKKDYNRYIPLAQSRRKLIERGERALNEADPNTVH